MQWTKEKVHNNKWLHYTLTNDNGMQVQFLDFGGIVTNITVPDKNGNKENITLAYNRFADYEKNPLYLGALIGRVAGRIANASFTINEKTYTVEANEGNHHLHGGTNGFHNIIWDSKPFSTDKSVGVKLTHTSLHGAEGYPGTINLTVTYTLTNDNAFIIHYDAKTDLPTILTLTNHAYFNLSGNAKETIHEHEVKMNSDFFVELDKELIPTGKKLPVHHTPFDFRKGQKLDKGIQSNFIQNKIAKNGYDHYFIFSSPTNEEQVKVFDKTSGRHMSIFTNQPGMVMYTSNGIDEGIQLETGIAKKYCGVCFETQASPASLEHHGFPTITLQPNEVYNKQTIFLFEW